MRSSYRLVDVPLVEGGTVRVELTAAASRLLGNLEARDYLLDQRGRPCWLLDAQAGRYALVVPVDYSRHPERLRAVNRDTVDELLRRDLIALGPDVDAPAYSYPATPAASTTARTVALTDLGRQRLRRRYAQDATR